MTKRDAELRLRGELARLGPLNPFEILGVLPTAGTEDIRAAFLAATKRYHPNLFGRESAQVQELATEVFLVVRRAYALLSDDAKRKALQDRMAPALSGPGPHPALTFAPAAPLSATPPTGVAPTATPPRGVPPTSQARVTPPTQPPRPVPPPQRPTPPTQPPRGNIPPTQPPRPAPRTQPPVGPAPAPLPPSQPAPTRGAPTPRSVTSVPGPAQRQRTTDVQAILDAAKIRSGQLEVANRHLAEGRFTQAREILQRIAVEDPQNKRYRARLHFAWGLEYRQARKLDEAVRELERAVALDPDNPEVAEVLRKTREVREQNRSMISKFLRR